MRLNELLYEAREADLYHGTDFESANSILKSDTLKAGMHDINSALPQSVKGHKKSVSFTRFMPVAKWFVDDSGDIGVVFVVDQAKLYRDVGKRLRPHDYEVFDDKPMPTHRSRDKSEYEEIVYGDVPNFSSYVKQIIIFIPKGVTSRDALLDLRDYRIFYDPRTIVVRTHEKNLTGRKFMELLKSKPKTKIDTSKVKKPDEII